MSKLAGLSVLNAENLDENAQLFFSSTCTRIPIPVEQWFDKSVPGVAAQDFSVIIIERILGGPFEGWFIGEVYHGSPHPFILIPPNWVVSQ